MSVSRYYSLDVAVFYALGLTLIGYTLKKLCWRAVISRETLKKKLD